MPITAILSDLFGVLLLRDPAWSGAEQWEVRLGLSRGMLAQTLFNNEMDELEMCLFVNSFIG